MIRFMTVASACVGLLMYAAITALSVPVDAQDNTDGRLGTLETRVADQSTEVSGLRRRVKRLEEVVLTPRAGEDTGTEDRARSNDPAGSTTITGMGTMVSDKFSLAAGRYKVAATLDVADFSGFICHLFGPDGFEAFVFNELIDTPGTWTGSTVVEVPTSGDYFVEVSNTSARWHLTFEEI